MSEVSAGILCYRKHNSVFEVFLIHPGGPYWSQKDISSWSIPKGGVNDGEEIINAAKREFEEETGFKPNGELIPLNSVKYKSGKTVFGWALEMDLDPTLLRSNSFELEWPPKSGKIQSFPEAEYGQWFDLETAKQKISQGQLGFLEELSTFQS